MYADGFAAGLLLIGLTVIVHRTLNAGPMRLWFRDGLLAGTAIAGSVYFRASNNLIPVALGGLALLLAAGLLVRRLRSRPLDRSLAANALITATAMFTTVLLDAALWRSDLSPRASTAVRQHPGPAVLGVVAVRRPNPVAAMAAGFGRPSWLHLDPDQCAEFIAEEPPPSNEELLGASDQRHPPQPSTVVHAACPTRWFISGSPTTQTPARATRSSCCSWRRSAHPSLSPGAVAGLS